MRRNALLAKPPQQFHRGLRHISPDLYEGVHTTGDEAIAAAYAMSAWRQSGGADSPAYPVILYLNTAGLEPLPDADAMHGGAMALDANRYAFTEALDGLSDPHEIVEEIRHFGEDAETQLEARIGDEPAAFIFDMIPRDPFMSLIDALEREGMDDEQIVAAVREFVRSGAESLPGSALTEMVDQQRYLADFNLDRLVKVVAFQPWWEEVVDEPVDEEEEAQLEALDAEGWRVWSIGEEFDIRPDPETVVYETGQLSLPGAPEPRVEYHGTLSTAVNQAFGNIIPTEPPYPLSTMY